MPRDNASDRMKKRVQRNTKKKNKEKKAQTKEERQAAAGKQEQSIEDILVRARACAAPASVVGMRACVLASRRRQQTRTAPMLPLPLVLSALSPPLPPPPSLAAPRLPAT